MQRYGLDGTRGTLSKLLGLPGWVCSLNEWPACAAWGVEAKKQPFAFFLSCLASLLASLLLDAGMEAKK